MFQQLARARSSVAARQNARLRRRIDHPIHGRKRIHITGHAKIAVHQLHAKPLQRQPIGFAALARKIVQSYDLDPFVGLQKGSSKVTARKSAYARNQNPHAGFLFRTIMNLWQS